jgi:hypothetical protein
MFATHNGQIIVASSAQSTPNGVVMGENAKAEVQPFVEACRKILETPQM